MQEYNFSPFRCKSPRKPACLISGASFYRCAGCGKIYYELPGGVSTHSVCCGSKMSLLEAKPAPEEFSYQIVGGFNNNAVVVHWREQKPAWIALKTFVGMYFKIVPEKKRSPVIFALADEDAYAYCGRKVCRKCLYGCKKGCELYFYLEDNLFIMAMDQIDPYFQVGK